MKEKNMSYQLTWLTSQPAVEYAPMSYDELDSIRNQGIVVLEQALKAAAPEKYSCPFFEKNSCLICEQRPLRCRTIKDGQQYFQAMRDEREA